MWSTSTDYEIWLLDPSRVGHGLVTSTGGFLLPLELSDRLIAADYKRFGSVGDAGSQVSWVVVRST